MLSYHNCEEHKLCTAVQWTWLQKFKSTCEVDEADVTGYASKSRYHMPAEQQHELAHYM